MTARRCIATASTGDDCRGGRDQLRLGRDGGYVEAGHPAYGESHIDGFAGQGAPAWFRGGLLADQRGDGFSRVHAPAESGRRAAGHAARGPHAGIHRRSGRDREQAVRTRQGRPPGDLELSRRTRQDVGLAFGPPEGEVRLRDTRRVVTFIACRRGEWPPGSIPDGWPVSGWVGILVARSPRCVPLFVWVDDEPTPRRTVIRFGVRDCG